MLALARRLALPFALLVALVAVMVAGGRLANDPLPAAATATTTDSAVTPVFSIRRAPSLLTPPSADDELVAGLQEWVDQLPENSCFVLRSGGRTLFEHQPQLPVTPASNMKILTAVAALEVLGPDHVFETTVAARRPPNANGVVNGDLYVIGGGDPVLMTDAYAAVQPERNSSIRTSADELVDATIGVNVSEIRGNVYVDGTRYDDARAVAEWPSRFLEEGQVGVLGGAVVDDGFVGYADGYASQDVGARDDPPPLPRSSDPAAQFAEVFTTMLRDRNVVVDGEPAVSPRTPRRLETLHVHRSPPLSEIVAQMLVNSDNTTAEMLVKEIGSAVSEQGTTGAGTIALVNALTSAGLVGDGPLFAVDGSGLAEADQANCGLIAAALDHDPTKSVVRDGMAVSGESGTLADTFAGERYGGRFRAKTGYLAHASALSGYFETDKGLEVTFSLVVNTGEGRDITPEDIVGWQRPLPRLLAPFPAGPPLDELGPVGASSGSD